MDDLVKQAMVRWPDVPAVYGWLRLDRRGRWLLVDRGMPGFDERIHGEGSEITSPQIVDFIGRNYACDEQQRWYWQNGPQRVFVDLEVAPLILRVLGSGADARLVAHTGHLVSRVDAALWTADGSLILLTDLGPGAIHDLDLAALELEESGEADPQTVVAVCGGRFTVRAMPADGPDLFERRPRPPVAQTGD